jgi:hypothetical protein
LNELNGHFMIGLHPADIEGLEKNAEGKQKVFHSLREATGPDSNFTDWSGPLAPTGLSLCRSSNPMKKGKVFLLDRSFDLFYIFRHFIIIYLIK